MKKILEWCKAFFGCEEYWLTMFVIFMLAVPLVSEFGKTVDFARTVGLFGLIYGANGYMRARHLHKRLDELERRLEDEHAILRKIKDRNG